MCPLRSLAGYLAGCVFARFVPRGRFSALLFGVCLLRCCGFEDAPCASCRTARLNLSPYFASHDMLHPPCHPPTRSPLSSCRIKLIDWPEGSYLLKDAKDPKIRMPR